MPAADVRARREKLVLDHFGENEELVCERVYFDQLSFLRQLLAGVNLRSPRGLPTMARVLRGFAKLSREPKDDIPSTPART